MYCFSKEKNIWIIAPLAIWVVEKVWFAYLLPLCPKKVPIQINHKPISIILPKAIKIPLLKLRKINQIHIWVREIL